MGKKRKAREGEGEGVGVSRTRTKEVKYCNLPNLQKKTIILGAELNLLDEYFKILDWMSYWGCVDGSDFDGLRTLNCSNGFPLIELEVIYQQNSKKFLISRSSLYILAFYSLFGWRIFKDGEFRIDFRGQAKQMSVKASYEDYSWRHLGFQPLIDAMNDMDSGNDSIASRGCMVFVVHFCEASRIKFIRLKIAQTIMPCISTDSDHLFHGEDGEDQVLGSNVCEDILPSLMPIIVDVNLVIPGNSQVEGFIKGFKQLCKAWMVYVLSRKKFCPLSRKIADKCGVKFVRTLRHSLSLLSNTNLDNIVKEWQKKFRKRKAPANFLKEDLSFMQRKVKQITDS